MGTVSRLLEFSAHVVAGFVAGLLNPALIPVATSVVSLVRKFVSRDRFEDVRDEVVRLVREGKIPPNVLIEVVREVLSREDVRKIVFRELGVEVDLVVDQFCFYYSNVDWGSVVSFWG